MIEPGTVVIVEQLDGDRAVGIVVHQADGTAGEVRIGLEDRPASIAEYWGSTIADDESVFLVRHAIVTSDGVYQPRGEAYPYPESKVLETVREPADRKGSL